MNVTLTIRRSWRCRTVHDCTRACPRDIRVTKAIAEVKQAILWGRV